MVVDDFDLVGMSVGESEADAVLIVDPDRMLTAPIATQFFQTVSGREFEILNGCGGTDKTKFSKSRRLQSSRKFPVSLIIPQACGVFAGEIFDHLKSSAK